ncbi:MAG: hypothetical protein WC354_05275 [Candidatus Omnitrophota bacterium]|jgi:hypothetical protein
MAFERFTNVGKSFKPKISIRGNSQIGFNCASIREFKLNEYKFAVLFYDKESKRIGIKLTNDKSEEGACKLRVRAEAGASMSARSFIDCYKLGSLKSYRFNVEWDAKEKMIIADLNDK